MYFTCIDVHYRKYVVLFDNLMEDKFIICICYSVNLKFFCETIENVQNKPRFVRLLI